MAIDRRTHGEQRRNGRPAREQRAAAQQKLCHHPTPVWEGVQSGHDPEVQEEAARSEAPVFGREFNCISTRHQVKLAEQGSVQLTQSVLSCAWAPKDQAIDRNARIPYTSRSVTPTFDYDRLALNSVLTNLQLTQRVGRALIYATL